jgi:hypothetical protein
MLVPFLDVGEETRRRSCFSSDEGVEFKYAVVSTGVDPTEVACDEASVDFELGLSMRVGKENRVAITFPGGPPIILRPDRFGRLFVGLVEGNFNVPDTLFSSSGDARDESVGEDFVKVNDFVPEDVEPQRRREGRDIRLIKEIVSEEFGVPYVFFSEIERFSEDWVQDVARFVSDNRSPRRASDVRAFSVSGRCVTVLIVVAFGLERTFLRGFDDFISVGHRFLSIFLIRSFTSVSISSPRSSVTLCSLLPFIFLVDESQVVRDGHSGEGSSSFREDLI